MHSLILLVLIYAVSVIATFYGLIYVMREKRMSIDIAQKNKGQLILPTPNFTGDWHLCLDAIYKHRYEFLHDHSNNGLICVLLKKDLNLMIGLNLIFFLTISMFAGLSLLETTTVIIGMFTIWYPLLNEQSGKVGYTLYKKANKLSVNNHFDGDEKLANEVAEIGLRIKKFDEEFKRVKDMKNKNFH